MADLRDRKCFNANYVQ